MSTESCVGWVDKLLRKFLRKFNPPDMPEHGTDAWDDMRDDWIEALDRRSATEQEAEAALRRLREDPPAWQRDHLPKLIHAIEGMRRERQTTTEASDRDQAQALSRHCEHCQGSGQVVIFRRGYEGRRIETMDVIEHGEVVRRRVSMTATAHCTCPMGRWIRQHTRDLHVIGRTPDLADVLAGRLNWTASDPTRREISVEPVSVERAKREGVVAIGRER